MTKAVRCMFSLMFLMLLSPSLYAAACTDVFGDSSGINQNLQSNGNTLDLSGVPWANNNWPASGTTLAGGDYYFSSRSFGNNYTLNIANGAEVRIFVNGSLSFGNGAGLNENGDADQLLLVTRGSLSFGNNTDVAGLVYSAGSINAGNNLYVVGSLAAAGSMGLGNNADIQFDDSGVGAGLLAGLCELTAQGGPVVVSANEDSVGPVTVDIDEVVALEAAVSDCPVPAFGFITQQWWDTWSINGSAVASNSPLSSACDRSPISRTETFSTAGQYDVEFHSQFRECFFGFFCGDWQTHGRDSIQIEVVESNPLTCFNDRFTGSGLNPDDWITSVSVGGFTPGIASNGRLRMTQAVSNQATAVTLQREIPGADNLVILEFSYYAYGGNGADGLAIALSDAAITAQPGSYGGSLGYAQRNNGSAGFAGGWLGIGLDEFGNFSNPTEGRIGGPGFRQDSITIRGASPDYRYLAGTNTLNPGIDQPNTNNPSPHRYRITIDSTSSGQALVSVERDLTGTGNNYQELVAPFNALNGVGQPSVPNNFLLSLTGSTGGSNNIHELDDVQLCALKLNPVGAQVDHFELIYDGIALTCQPETVTIKACENADCSTPFTDNVDVTLSPAGWVGGGTFSFTGGETTRDLQNTTAGTVTIGVASSSPSTRPFTQNVCSNGSGTLNTAQCNLTFVDSGLAFDAPDVIADKPSELFKVRAVQRSDETNACVPAFSDVTRTVQFWSDYVTPGPAGRPARRPVLVNNSTVGQTAASASSLSLYFDSNGEAEIDIRYADAGALTLNALYEGIAATSDVDLEMPGADGFNSRPAGFCVQTSGDCLAGDASCPVFTQAGADFDLRVRAMGWQSDGDTNLCTGNSDTPNFELSGMGLSHSLVEPTAGTAGTINAASYDHSRSANAQETVIQRVSEVGVFRFTVTPTNTYFGYTLSGAMSAPVGRFIPDRFSLAVVEPGEVAPFCDSAAPFAYMGRALGWKPAAEPVVRLTARVANGNGITANYTDDDFRRLDETGLTWMPDGGDGTTDNTAGVDFPVSASLDAGDLSVNSPGVMHYRFADSDTLTYEKAVTSKITPFLPDYSLRLTTLADLDGVSSGALPFPVAPAMPFELRYGRLALENAFGPETMPLTVPMRAEYFDGTRFGVNSDDSCWSYDTDSEVTLTPGSLTSVSGASDALSQGRPPLASVLELNAPGAGNPGEVTAVYGVPLWLQGDYDEDGSLENPSALATFGVYRGHDRVIYWREK